MRIKTIQDLLFFIRNGCEGSEQEQYINDALELYQKDCSK